MATETPSAVPEAQDEHLFTLLAHKYWLKAKAPSKVQPDVLKNQIWDNLEKENFPNRSLLLLESLQLFEKYLWPTFTDDASDYHVLLIAFLINIKRRENLPSWSLFADRPADFLLFFRRALSTLLDTTLKPRIRTQTIVAIIGAFQSLDNATVRQACAPLVSVSVWHNLHSAQARDRLLEEYPQFKRAWRAATKRYDNADEEVKSRMRFDRSWLYTLLLDFLDLLFNQSRHTADDVLYAERFVEFLCDLQSQFPTRRYVNTLLKDLNLPLLIKLSPLYNDAKGALMREQYILLKHYTSFHIDDQTGQPQSDDEAAAEYTAGLMKLQRTALKHFKDKLTLLALSNHGSLSNKDELQNMLQPLSDEELKHFVSLLGRRTEYPNIPSISVGRDFLLAIVQSVNENKSTFKDTVREMAILPTEDILYEDSFVRNEYFDDTQSLAIPKLNIQYLTVADFFWRSFILYRCEAFFEIKRDLEDTVKRMQPARNHSTGQTQFKGVSRMALASSKPAIIEVVAPKVGDGVPAEVRAELILDVSRINEGVRKEWESLRPDDVVFLLNVPVPDQSRRTTNGGSSTDEHKTRPFQRLRCAEVIQVMDEKGRPIRHADTQENGYHGRPRQLRLLTKLDAKAYQQDAIEGERERDGIYDSINLCIRRRSRENNFKPMLETIRHLTLSDAPLPGWLQDVFLGFGDPNSVSYKNMKNKIESIDFRDTFLNWDHLRESLAGAVKAAPTEQAESFEPPYVLSETKASETSDDPTATKRRKREGNVPEAGDGNSRSSKSAKQYTTKESGKASKKRRHEEVEDGATEEVTEVSTYKPPNNGPYPADAPRTNSIRFTSAQVDAIRSGTQPGLTMIVGPPGTGKTDVATQIINNIYHNFPNQRTLLIAHSNQALNQLFQKIVALDIDQRHLLRLGHGEEDLQLAKDASYSKSGRVEYFLENRDAYLLEVNRLASSLGAPGAHGSSCETADYFNAVYVKPTWKKYLAQADNPDSSAQDIIWAFPFLPFFSDAPQPLFPFDASKEVALDIAQGCYRHIDRIFTELEEIRPFEVLRYARDKSNYLLVSEARIIAMTTTHAAMRRQEIADLGFRYDNVVIEEAAQVTEIEDVIPLALQSPTEDNDMPVQRVILLGDHLQNSPIVQNQAFRQFSRLDQSLFLRLVRLGVPTFLLDAQGRARPSIAGLYRFRYPRLTDLPHVSALPEFTAANAGFRYEYQFLDVGDYKGKGEAEPTPHFLQNLGEAEYAVALFMYMRLLGYPARSITILTSYAGQRALVRDVLAHRCKGNKLFGLPRAVATMDKYQGEQNDYIILSLVRTSRPGFLRDIRRLTVALSRARLGLYVLGRRAVFDAVPELAPAFAHLFARPTDALHIVTGEMHPTTRNVEDDADSTRIEGVEHLGKYVYEMTKHKLASLNQRTLEGASTTAGGAAASGNVAIGATEGVAGELESRMDEAIDMEDDEDAGIQGLEDDDEGEDEGEDE